MRLIDADKLRESVLKWLPTDPCGQEEKEYPFETDICVSMLQEIEEAPTIEPEPHWIPCSERLPEDIRPVIVTWCNQYIVGKRFIGVAHYKSGKWYWYSSTTEDFLAEYGRYDGEEFYEAIEVIAWCELPEPYERRQDADR